jgi:hypothetical protein
VGARLRGRRAAGLAVLEEAVSGPQAAGPAPIGAPEQQT